MRQPRDLSRQSRTTRPSPVASAVDALYKLFKLGRVQGLLTEVDDIDCDIVLLELLAQGYQFFFRGPDGRCYECNDSLRLCLVLTML